MAEIWDPNDKWHIYTKQRIQAFVKRVFSETPASIHRRVVNIGSGDNNYGLEKDSILNIDIAINKLKRLPNGVLSDCHAVPVRDGEAEVIICVGSVINYCDAFILIEEFSRLLKNGGTLILEFECSKSWELMFSRSFNKNSALIRTFYNNDTEMIWVYSQPFIENALKVNGFVVREATPFHLISPLVYKITRSSDFASKLAKLDPFATRIPILRTITSNVILLCEKNT